MDRRRILEVERAERFGDPHPLVDSGFVEELDAIAEAEALVRRVRLVDRRQLLRSSRHHQRAALAVLDVEPFRRRDPPDLVDGTGHRPVDRQRGFSTVFLRQCPETGREAGGAPGPVPAGGTEPGDLLLDDRDLQPRLPLLR